MGYSAYHKATAGLSDEDRRILEQSKGETLREIIDRNLTRKRLGLPMDLSFRALAPHAKSESTIQ